MNASISITSKSISARCVRQITLVTLLAVLGTAPTWAAPTSITVSFRDLDLSSIAGATTLYHRIQSAARQVCGYAPGADLIERAAWQQARVGAVRRVTGSGRGRHFVRPVAASSPPRSTPAHLLRAVRAELMLVTELVIMKLPVSLPCTLSTARAISLPVTESRSSATSVMWPALVVYVRLRPADIFSGAVM
jgi:UrcA family protein